MTTAELLEALRALPPAERRALALRVLAEVPADATTEASNSSASPVDASRGWPVFTSSVASDAPPDAFDHRRYREERIDSQAGSVGGAGRD
jgi:hypothetical protein